jgi:hypothetical protein
MKFFPIFTFFLFAFPAIAQESPNEVTEQQVAIYKSGMDRGCRDSGRRRGDRPARTDAFCSCVARTLDEQMKFEQWQQAYFFSVRRLHREEERIVDSVLPKLKHCRENLP